MLKPGSELGTYEILALVGAGGMGEVYRARDTKLGRDVAIKVLPEEFSQHRERLDRFEREAKLLAALNHANVATLYGFEESDGQQFLVMELVQGDTLAERIAKGPIPVDEAILLFIQMAKGLEARPLPISGRRQLDGGSRRTRAGSWAVEYLTVFAIDSAIRPAGFPSS